LKNEPAGPPPITATGEPGPSFRFDGLRSRRETSLLGSIQFRPDMLIMNSHLLPAFQRRFQGLRPGRDLHHCENRQSIAPSSRTKTVTPSRGAYDLREGVS